MTGEMERLLRAAKFKLDELHKRAQDYTASPSPDPVRIAVYHYTFAGGTDIVAALEAEARAIQAEQEQNATAR
jgi:hypothetical protein